MPPFGRPRRNRSEAWEQLVSPRTKVNIKQSEALEVYGMLLGVGAKLKGCFSFESVVTCHRDIT